MPRPRPAMLVALLSLILSPAAVIGQEDEELSDFEELYLGGILQTVVTAAKHEQDIAESPSAISVITREQIENTHCQDVICLLRQVPEMDVKRITPMYASVGARALTDALGDKVLVLVDGQEINSEVFGIPFWQLLTVHLEDIERIEVIRGPGSALYGANAHSGVISMITRRPEKDTSEAFLGGGEHNRVSLHLRLDRNFDKWRLQVTGGVDTADHWRIQGQPDRELGRARLVLERQGDSGRSYLHVGLVGFRGTIYTSLTPLDNRFGMMAYALAGHQTDWLKGQLSVSLLDTEFDFDMLPLTYGPTKIGEPPPGMHIFTSTLDAETQVNLELFSGNLLIAGCNYRWNSLISEDNHPEETHQHRVGVFLHDEQRLAERLILTGGLRFDYNTITPYSLSPRLAVVYQFSPGQFARLAAGMAFRKPSFFNTSMHIKGFKGEEAFPELEKFFLDNLGNPDAGNESITTLETGYVGRFLDNRLTAEAVAFYNRYRNTLRIMVDLQTGLGGLPDLARSTMLFESSGREVDTLGGSLSFTWQVAGFFRANLNYTYRHSWYVSEPGDVTAEIGEGHEGDRVAWEPAHLFNASLHYLRENGLRLGMAAHAESSANVAKTEHGGAFDPYVLVHLPSRLFISGFVAWRIPVGSGWLEMGTKVFNLLHAGFRDNASVTRPDGSELGGELIGRRIFFYIRGAL